MRAPCCSAAATLVITTALFFQAEDGIRDVERSRGLGDVYKRQILEWDVKPQTNKKIDIFNNYHVILSKDVLMA